ncbi:MAG: glycosyltransferase [Calditrichaeota bacterium]|nr:glycosyltransferase [Calditrichota bacterium]
MSAISVLPYAATLEHWWEQLRGESGRLRFMAWKVLEVVAFCGVWPRARSSRTNQTPTAWLPPPSRPNNAVGAAPSVVVVVPARIQTASDATRLQSLLVALASQTRWAHVVVVDDASPRWPQTQNAEVIRLPHNNGPAAARNRGLQRALELSAEIVAFTDADCVPDSAWIEKIIQAFHLDRSAHAISGATLSKDQSWLGRYHERNGTLNGRRLAGSECLLYGPTCNLALCADLAAVLRFDESFPFAAAEDIDFCCRAIMTGWQIRHSTHAVVWHDFGYDQQGVVGRLERFWKQFRKYGHGERVLLQKQPDYPRLFAFSQEIPVCEREQA